MIRQAKITFSHKFMTLGDTLKAARSAAGLSLRSAEALTGISNGYLSQLESGSVKAPSPRHLHQLALAYKASYRDFMMAADYPLPDDEPAGVPSKLRTAISHLTADEEEQVYAYAEVLRRGRQPASRRAAPAPRPAAPADGPVTSPSGASDQGGITSGESPASDRV